MAKVTLKEARSIILSGEVFDLQWSTADEKRQTGGERRKVQGLQICGSSHSNKKHGTFTVKKAGKISDYKATIHWDLVERINGDEVLP